MKTIEERAAEFMEKWKAHAGPPIMAEDFMAWVVSALRNLAEDCALICERHAEDYRQIQARPGGNVAYYGVVVGNKCANEIRALYSDDLADPWEVGLMREIARARARRAVVPVYSNALRYGHGVDWGRVHQAIMERWSNYGVEWIRREANKHARKGEEA